MKYLIILVFLFSTQILKAESYTLHKSSDGKTELIVTRDSDGAFIPFDLMNRDYVKYNEWKSKGNTPKIVLKEKPTPEEIRHKEYPNVQKQLESLWEYIDFILDDVQPKSKSIEIRNKIKSIKERNP